MYKRIRIDLRRIIGKSSFHSVFAEIFGFPVWYGRNMDAWVDRMTSLDAPDGGMTAIALAPGELLVLELEQVEDFRRRCPQQWSDLVDASAFVNHRRIECDERAVIVLAYQR